MARVSWVSPPKTRGLLALPAPSPREGGPPGAMRRRDRRIKPPSPSLGPVDRVRGRREQRAPRALAPGHGHAARCPPVAPPHAVPLSPRRRVSQATVSSAASATTGGLFPAAPHEVLGNEKEQSVGVVRVPVCVCACASSAQRVPARPRPCRPASRPGNGPHQRPCSDRFTPALCFFSLLPGKTLHGSSSSSPPPPPGGQILVPRSPLHLSPLDAHFRPSRPPAFAALPSFSQPRASLAPIAIPVRAVDVDPLLPLPLLCHIAPAGQTRRPASHRPRPSTSRTG